MGDLIINIMYIVIIFIGIWYIIKDFSTITTGILISFLTIIPKIYSSFRVLLNVNISSKIIKNSMEKLDEIYSIEPETNIYDGINIDDIYSIEFIDVSFKYGDGLFEVKKLNFKVEKGEKLGIVGMSGGGKTTLFDLITRIIIPNEGQILINNIDHQRNQHRNNSSHKCILETTIENIQVTVCKSMKICYSLSIQNHTIRKSCQIFHSLSRHLSS